MRGSSPVAAAWKWMLLGVVAASSGTAAADDPIAVNERTFAIPVQVVAGDPEVAEVRLYCSTDGGKHWRIAQRAKPPVAGFEFSAGDDVEYWFLVRTADALGRESSQSTQPELKVAVDTTAPRLELNSASSADGSIVITWKIDDVHADAASLKFHFRPSETSNWTEVVPIRSKRQGDDSECSGTMEWRPPTDAPGLTLRMEACDAAGNSATKEFRLFAANDESPPDDAPQPATVKPIGRPAASSSRSGALSLPPPPRDPSLPLFVNSLSFELDYDIDRVPEESLEKVELWGTRDDGLTWVRLGLDADRRSPCTVNVEREGRYGFAIVAEAAGGGSGRPPFAGEPPEIRVVVDLTVPKARLTTAEPDPSGETGSLKINWQASDSNLGPNAVSLAYSSSRHGPWLPLALGVPNDGGRVCRFDPQSPDNVYLRIEVRDEAGNLGAFSTTTPIPVEKRKVNYRVAGSGPEQRPGAAPKWFHVLR